MPNQTMKLRNIFILCCMYIHRVVFLFIQFVFCVIFHCLICHRLVIDCLRTQLLATIRCCFLLNGIFMYASYMLSQSNQLKKSRPRRDSNRKPSRWTPLASISLVTTHFSPEIITRHDIGPCTDLTTGKICSFKAEKWNEWGKKWVRTASYPQADYGF